MQWSHGWGLAGQLIAIWIVLSIGCSLLIGRLFREPKSTYSVLRNGTWVEIDRAQLIRAIEADEKAARDSTPNHSPLVSVRTPRADARHYDIADAITRDDEAFHLDAERQPYNAA